MWVCAHTCVGSTGLIRLTERAQCDADSSTVEDRPTGGSHPLGFPQSQHARMSCSTHCRIPDSQTFINYKMKIDNPWIPICVLTKHHAMGKKTSKNTVIKDFCNKPGLLWMQSPQWEELSGIGTRHARVFGLPPSLRALLGSEGNGKDPGCAAEAHLRWWGWNYYLRTHYLKSGAFHCSCFLKQVFLCLFWPRMFASELLWYPADYLPLFMDFLILFMESTRLRVCFWMLLDSFLFSASPVCISLICVALCFSPAFLRSH